MKCEDCKWSKKPDRSLMKYSGLPRNQLLCAYEPKEIVKSCDDFCSHYE